MKTTTKSSALDDHKLKYELTPTDPQKPKPKAIKMSSLDMRPVKKELKRVTARRPGIIRGYFKYMVEVILA